MSRLQRHQHVFQTWEGESVTSTLIPFKEAKLEAITLTSLHYLIGVEPAQALRTLATNGIKVNRRHGQEWVAVQDAMRAFDLRSRE